MTSVQKVLENASAVPMLLPLVMLFYESSTSCVRKACALFANGPGLANPLPRAGMFRRKP
jgi:hypothetical protein